MSARPTAPFRASTSKPSGSPLQSQPTTLLSPSASLTGTHAISLGSKVIIQIRANLVSTYGPITIADGSIIAERTSTGVLSPPTFQNAERPNLGVTIGPGVLVESGAVVEASSVGAFTIIENGARIGKGAVVGAYCKICARVEVKEGAEVEDGTVVYGAGWGEWRREGTGGGLDVRGMRRAYVAEIGEVLRRIWTGK